MNDFFLKVDGQTQQESLGEMMTMMTTKNTEISEFYKIKKLTMMTTMKMKGMEKFNYIEKTTMMLATKKKIHHRQKKRVTQFWKKRRITWDNSRGLCILLKYDTCTIKPFDLGKAKRHTSMREKQWQSHSIQTYFS